MISLLPSGTWLPLLSSWALKIHEVWTNWKDLRATHHAAKISPKDIDFFKAVLPTKSPKIMDLRGIHSPKALQWWEGVVLSVVWKRRTE